MEGGRGQRVAARAQLAAFSLDEDEERREGPRAAGAETTAAPVSGADSGAAGQALGPGPTVCTSSCLMGTLRGFQLFRPHQDLDFAFSWRPC